MTRIDEVRKALAQVLPAATKFRKVGLITYGPGPYLQCNVALDFRPMPNAAQQIMSVVNALNPAGKTPLVKAVELAAEVLDYRSTRGVVVLLTDGEETCGGAPCALGKSLKDNGRLTVHVIGYQLRNFRWTGAALPRCEMSRRGNGRPLHHGGQPAGSGGGVREDSWLPHDVGC